MASTLSQRIAEFANDVRINEIPAEVRKATMLHALDTLGCGLAGFALDSASWVLEATRETNSTGAASAFGIDHGLAEGDAAFLNGTLCHSLDFDDTDPVSIVHVSATIVPTVIATGQTHGATGEKAVVALALGNEISTRIGAAAPGVFHARGFHPTGVCGVFGATIAASYMRGLSVVQTVHALGIAGSMASGLLEFLEDGAETKKLHPGWAAQAGIAATRLAFHGATGPATIFEGDRGLFSSFLRGVSHDLGKELADLGTNWRTPQIAFKPYPACHYTHAPVDALASIQREHGLRPEDVDHIVAFSDDTGISLVLEPADHKSIPRTPYDAKFSLPYCLGVQAVRGKLEISDFVAGRIADPTVLRLASRVTYERRVYSSRSDSFGGGVRVHTADGRIFEAELRYQRGGAENPLSDDAVIAKYQSNSRLALSPEESISLKDSVLTLEASDDLSSIAIIGAARHDADVRLPQLALFDGETSKTA